jgi:S-disulfanyl-L-cysteine oxidoreductase SoxD
MQTARSAMFMRSLLAVVGVTLSAVGAAAGDAPRLGVALSAEAVASWDISVFPDGRGLPPGRGTAVQGRVIYEAKCAGCHGVGGRGATAEELVGRGSLVGPDPEKTIGSYWPYATTIFDMTKRSMPMDAPGSLTDNEVYALTAYLLFANELISEVFEINPQTLSQVAMPNRNGFDRIEAR